MKKSNGTLYWYDLTGNVIEETNLTGTLTNTYAFFNGQRVVRWGSSSEVYYFSNHLGSATVLTNVTGGVIERSDFYPYGGERVVTDGDSNRYKFTGKERDETGLDYFGARFQLGAAGRFSSVDPEQISLRHLVNPQKLNRYAYVLNNPLLFIDPDGLEEKIAVRVNVFYSSNLSPANRSAADGSLAQASNSFSRAGLSLNVKSTTEFKVAREGGIESATADLGEKNAVNLFFVTGVDTGGRGSRSGISPDGKLGIFITSADVKSDSTITMFELVQGLTADGNANPVTNALKDLFFTNWITAALDGTDLSRSVADILTLGGISDMKKNAENYADQALCGGDQVCDPAEKYKK